MDITIKSIGISGLAALLIFGLEACQQRGQNRLHQPQRIISDQIGKKKTEEFNRLREQKDKELRGNLRKWKPQQRPQRRAKTINERKIKDLIEQIQNKTKK